MGNQSIKDAQNKIKIKNNALKEKDKRHLTETSAYVKKDKNEEKTKYNYGKRKSKFTSKDVLCKKKLRKTEEGKEKQHMIDNASKKIFRGTPEGQKKQREVDNASKKKIRDTLERQNKQREVNNASNRNLKALKRGRKNNKRWIMHQR